MIATIVLLSRTGDPAAASPSGSDVIAGILFVVGIVMLATFVVISIRGKIARRNAAIPTPRERIEKLKTSAAAETDVHAARAELLDTAQRLAGQIDAKSERLTQLIDRADERIEVLSTLLVATEPDRNAVEAGSRETPTADRQEPESAREASEVESIAPPESIATPENIAPDRVAAFEHDEPTDPLTLAVYQLADSGRGPVEIARELDEQIGKVELILALRGEVRGV